jgi:protein TonB
VPAPAAPTQGVSPPPSIPVDAAPRDSAPGAAAEAPRTLGAEASASQPSSERAAPRPSGLPGAAQVAGAELDGAGGPGAVRGSSDQSVVMADPGSGGSSAIAGGDSIARLTPGLGRGGNGAGPDGAIPPEYEGYVRALRQRVQDRLAYPWTAVRRGQQGVVEVELRLGSDGRLVAVAVVAGSSADALRVAAVTAVRDAAPFPFPPGLSPRPLVIRLPVEFRLR